MGTFFRRLASIIVAVGFGVFGGIRLALDLIGWSTAPDDVGVAMTRLDQLLGWLLAVPGWIVLLCVLISAMWLMWVSWPHHRTDASPTTHGDPPRLPAEQVIRLVQETKAVNGQIVNIRPGKKIQFDCNDGWNFYFELTSHDHILAPPLNPKEGSYRLYIVQKGRGSGLFAVTGSIRWAGWGSEFPQDGDLSIYEIDVLAGSDGFQYVGRLIFDTGPRVVEKTILAEDIAIEGKHVASGRSNSGSLYKGSQVIVLDAAQAASALLRVSVPGISHTPLQLQFCVAWHVEQDTEGKFTLEFVPAPMNHSKSFEVSLADTARKRVPTTSNWSPMSDARVGSDAPKFRLKISGEGRAFIYSVTIRFLIPSILL